MYIFLKSFVKKKESLYKTFLMNILCISKTVLTKCYLFYLIKYKQDDAVFFIFYFYIPLKSLYKRIFLIGL